MAKALFTALTNVEGLFPPKNSVAHFLEAGEKIMLDAESEAVKELVALKALALHVEAEVKGDESKAEAVVAAAKKAAK